MTEKKCIYIYHSDSIITREQKRINSSLLNSTGLLPEKYAIYYVIQKTILANNEENVEKTEGLGLII